MYIGIETINILEGTINIKNNIFYNKSNIINYNFPKSLKKIGKYTFCSNTSIINLTFPINLKKIEDNAFTGCIGLRKIIFQKNITHIGNSAFSGCINLNNVILPNSLKKIGKNAFYRCNSIRFADCLSYEFIIWAIQNRKKHKNTQIKGFINIMAKITSYIVKGRIWKKHNSKLSEYESKENKLLKYKNLNNDRF